MLRSVQHDAHDAGIRWPAFSGKRRNAQAIVKHLHILILLFIISLACSSGCSAGVAAYQLDAGTTAPASVSYWLSGDATSVTVDIIDAATSAVVYTFPTITGVNATKGFHSGVVTWNGEASGGGTVTPGNYKIRATVVSDMSGTSLRPLWEKPIPGDPDSGGWQIYGIAINRNPDSPFYGRVYVGNYIAGDHTKAVHEFNPDGTEIGSLPEPAELFGGSGPWGLCVDADDHVYVSNRSNAQPGGTAGPSVWQYHWDGSAWVCTPRIGGLQNDRYLGCNHASGPALRLVDTYYPANGTGAFGRMYVGAGDPPTVFASTGDKAVGGCYMQPAIDDGDTVFVAGINWTDTTPNALWGALTQWSLSGNPVNDPNSTESIKNRNSHLTQATGIALTSDDSYIWMARQGGQVKYSDTETSPFYKFPKSMAMTVTPEDSVNLKKYDWGTAYNVPTIRQYPRFIAADGQSNLAVAGVDSIITAAGSVFGLYAEPTGSDTSEVRVGRNAIVFGNYSSTITGTISEGRSGGPAAGVTIRVSKGSYFREAVTDSTGTYSVEVAPGTGYTVAPVTNIYKNTLPTEYNLQSDWPADPGTSDWPKTTDARVTETATVDGRVWPLAVTQATYDWATHIFRSGGRTLCVAGTVLRQAADSTITPRQNGYDGYYFISDTIGGPNHDTQQSVKVKVFGTGSECKKGDKIVVVGTFDPPPSYRQGIVTPVFAPVVLSSDNALPSPRDATNLTRNALYGNMIGGYYVMKAKAVSRVDTGDDFYVQVTNSVPPPATLEFAIDMNTAATTGLVYPELGQVFDMYGILDEIAPSNSLRAIRLGEPGDMVPCGAVPDIATAKSKSDDTVVSLQGAQLTAVAGGGVPSGVAYIEQPNRINALRIHMSSLPSDVDAGDLVDVQGTMATSAQGERFVEASYMKRLSGARPIDAIGMNNRDIARRASLGLFVKTWGKVSPADTDSFMISDGSRVPIKVMCGLLAKPETGRVVRVRGVVSSDSSGPLLLMRNERVDWAYGEEAYQPIPLPGAFKYARDFLVCGPFADADSAPGADPALAQTYRLDHDFISAVTGGMMDESSVRPYPGMVMGTGADARTWVRSDGIGDHADFLASFPTNNTNCTFYACLYVYSPTELDAAIRVGSDDSIKVFHEAYGEMLRHLVNNPPTYGRTEMIGEDVCGWFPIHVGLNRILLKVEQGTGPSGVDCQVVDSSHEGGPGWGNASPVLGLGYLLDER